MLKEIISGATSYFRAIKVIHQRRLWHYFLLPGMVSVLFFLFLSTIVYFTFTPMGNWIASAYPAEWWGKGILEASAGVLFSVILILLGGVLFRYVLIIALGPFLSSLSEKIEYHYNRKRYPKNLKTNVQGIWRGVRVAVSLLFFELLFTLPLYPFLLIPGLNVIITPLIFCISSYYAGRGNMDFTFERRFGVLESIRTGKKHKWLAFGNGLVYMLMISSIIGVFFAPILSAAGLTVELVKRLDGIDKPGGGQMEIDEHLV